MIAEVAGGALCMQTTPSIQV